MTHVITGGCCNDAACVFVCPVNCIHPAPGEPGYGTAEILFIDSDVCIDCGACVDACPVDAIVPDYDLEPEDEPFALLASEWFATPGFGTYERSPQVLPNVTVSEPEPLRVAVVGTGPAACYVVDSLTVLRGTPVQVTVLERLLTPGGLVRYGVAPDHQETKRIGEHFLRVLGRPGVDLRLGVELGRDVTVDELAADHHAVVVATGAAGGRRLGIPGEDRQGVVSAVDFVGWYNGHPDHAALAPDLSHERAVLVGNGNVALDVARVLLSGVDRLGRTDIAEHALEQLAESNIREVVVLGRRGLEHAAFTASEIDRLARLEDLGVVVPDLDLDVDLDQLGPDRRALVAHKVRTLRRLNAAPVDGPTMMFRFGVRPEEILGGDRVSGVRLSGGEALDCGLVLTSIGYRAEQLTGLPFDETRGVIPNARGRVLDHPGIYVTGWIKRGPSGGIGTNRWDADETAASIVEDYTSGRLSAPSTGTGVGARLASAAGIGQWRVLDRHERDLGRSAGRPRIKIVSPNEQRALMS